MVEDDAGIALNTPPAPAASAERAGVRGWYTVVVLALVVMLAQIDRNIISLLVQPMKRDLHLSDTQVSLVIGLSFTFFYVIVGPPVSRIADRGFRKTVIASSLAIWSFATAFCGLAQSFWHIAFSRGVIGGAESACSPASLSLIADVIPRRHLPRAYAIYNSGFMGGMALSLVVGGLLLGHLANVPPIHVPGIGEIRSWQLVFMIVGLPGLLVAALIVLTVPSPARRIAARPKGYPLRDVFAYLARNRALHLPLLLGMLANSIMNFGAAAWLPAFYERTYGWGPAQAGPMIGTFLLLGSLIGIFLGARAAEWLGKKHDDANIRVLFLANLCSAPFLIMAPLMPNPWLALCSNGLGGIIITMGGAGYNSALQVSTPIQMRAQINALYLFTIGGLGGAFGPLLIALLTDFVAGADNYLRYVLFGFRLVLAPLDAFLIWLAIKPYGLAVRQRIEAGD